MATKCNASSLDENLDWGEKKAIQNIVGIAGKFLIQTV